MHATMPSLKFETESYASHVAINDLEFTLLLPMLVYVGWQGSTQSLLRAKQALHQLTDSPSPQFQPSAWLITSAWLRLTDLGCREQAGQRPRTEGVDILGCLSPLNVSVQRSWPQRYKVLSFFHPEV